MARSPGVPRSLCLEGNTHHAHWRDREETGHDPPVPGRWAPRARDRPAARRSPGRRTQAKRIATVTSPSSLAPAVAKAKNVAKPQRGHFGKAEVEPKAKMVEFRVVRRQSARRGRRDFGRPFRRRPDGRCPGRDAGQGLRRRHEALGLRRSARDPRRVGLAPFARLDRQPPGSGQASSRTRRWPATWARAIAPSRTSRSSSTDVERGLIFVKGSVPGSKGGWLIVKDAVKVRRHADAPYPAGLKQAANSNTAADTPGRDGCGA